MVMDKLKVVRAQEEYQRAGAYSVRIQGMNREHNISLREEFDEHDGEECKYIVLLDKEYPVATCRFYPLNNSCVLLGRVVVLPEYRGKELGRKVIGEAEKWICELGYSEIVIDSRLVAEGFYKKLGYLRGSDEVFNSWKFKCVRMYKRLK